MVTGLVISFANMFLLDAIEINGSPINKAFFTISLMPIIVVIIYALVSDVLCWALRTKCMQTISPNVVSVIMPTSAIITAITSVIFSLDAISWQLIVGGILGFSSAIIASFSDRKKETLKKDTQN